MKRLRTLTWSLVAVVGLLVLVAAPATASGPPFPPPIRDIVVYDTAGIFDAATIGQATKIILGIEARTGAEVVVYTQTKPGVSDEEAAADAQALGNQWGVGRAGFDDGLVILFDMETSGQHGAVQLQAGSGYKAAYLSDRERQSVFDDTMLPLLQDGRIDAALLAALRVVDANATPEHAAALDRARILNAIVGLVVAPLLFVVLVGIFGWRWYRVGRDPVYLDDASIHMPAPPPGLTPAVAALLMDDRSSPHTLTTAMVDLAGQGAIAFDLDKTLLATKVSLVVADAPDVPDAGVAEASLLRGIRRDAVDGRIEHDDLYVLRSKVDGFDRALEKEATDAGWFREPPKKAAGRWARIGTWELVLGFIGGLGAIFVVASGLTLLAIALLAAGVTTLILSRFMTSRTLEGARLYAWLSAYRRTLQKTMAQAISMNEVVSSAVLPWVKTPDQATIWAVALGLHREVEAILQRSTEAAVAAASSAAPIWFPAWYGAGVSAGAGGARGPSLFSASAIPAFGGMFAVLGSIRWSAGAPHSSGSSSGFSGGFSGGGGFSSGSVGGHF